MRRSRRREVIVQLDGRVVVVTGASRGIGAELSERLAGEGAIVALVARSPEGLAEVAGRIRAAGGRCGTFPADLLDLGALPDLVAGIEQQLGPISGLVNNAGVDDFQHFTDATVDEISRVVGLNVTAVLALTRLVLPGMLERGEGQVVSMASVAGLVGTPFGAVYAATKAAVVAATHSLRMEFEGGPVGFSAPCPAFVHGAGMHEVHKELAGRAPVVLGGTTTAAVVDEVVAALRSERPERIVNDLPMRPLVGLGRALPGFADWLVARMSRRYMQSIADARRKARAAVQGDPGRDA